MSPLRVKRACILGKGHGLKDLPWPGLFSKLETPHASLVSLSRPCLEAEVKTTLVHRPCSQLFPSRNL